jgi:hypothetical protein
MRSNALLPVSQARFAGSQERMLSADGHINAGSTQELAKRMLEMASAMSRGELVASETAATSIVDQRALAAERAAALREAYHDKTGVQWAELGASFSNNISLRLDREGFMRNVLDRGTVEDGGIPRIRVRQRNVKGIMSRGPVQVYPQYLRDSYQNLDEFYITAQPRIEEIDLVQGSGDILEDKYFEGLEAIWAAEDRTLIKMLRSADSIYNPVTYFAGALTPTAIQTVKYNVERWKIPLSNMIIALDLLNDLVAGTTFSSWFDPISKWEIVQTGRIGTLLGMSMLTDGYREPTLRVLNDGEFLVLGTPEYLGGYTDRGPVESRAVDQFDQWVPARGWSMWEILSMGVSNAKAIARGSRI